MSQQTMANIDDFDEFSNASKVL